MTRIACCVPFCRRTAPRERFPTSEEIICGKCWKLVSRATKAQRRRLGVRSRKFFRMFIRERGNDGPRASKFHRLDAAMAKAWDRNWEACKREATEGRAGIG